MKFRSLNTLNYSGFCFQGMEKRDEQQGFLASFSPGTFPNVEINPQNFLTFSFNPFATLLQIFNDIPGTSPILLSLNQDCF